MFVAVGFVFLLINKKKTKKKKITKRYTKITKYIRTYNYIIYAIIASHNNNRNNIIVELIFL